MRCSYAPREPGRGLQVGKPSQVMPVEWHPSALLHVAELFSFLLHGCHSFYFPVKSSRAKGLNCNSGISDVSLLSVWLVVRPMRSDDKTQPSEVSLHMWWPRGGRASSPAPSRSEHTCSVVSCWGGGEVTVYQRQTLTLKENAFRGEKPGY